MIEPYYELDGVTVYNADFRDVLDQLGEHVADCIIADPPYGETALDWDRRVPNWPSLIVPALKPTGSLWCFGSMRLFLETVEDWAAWRMVQDIVWEKHNGSNFAADRFRRVHEIAIQWRPARIPWNQIYRKPVVTMDAVKRSIPRKHGGPAHTGEIGAFHFRSEAGGARLMRSVIAVRSCHGRAQNETQKPEGIVAPLVEYSCPAGGVVLDPFAGSGTTGTVAREMGLTAILIEKRAEQCEVIRKRLEGALL